MAPTRTASSLAESVLFNDAATSFAVAVQAPSVAPGTVTYNNFANPYTLSGAPITGGAAIEKTGTGTLTLSIANSYSGQTTIKDGTVILQNNTALGTVAGGTTVTNTGTLDVGDMNLGAEMVTVSGAGVDGNGAIVNNSGVEQINALQQVVLAGNAAFGGNARWDLRRSGNALDMGGGLIIGQSYQKPESLKPLQDKPLFV